MKKKKEPLQKPISKKLFFVTVPMYDREICVIVGMTHKEAISSAKRQKCTKEYVETLESEFIASRGFWENKRVLGEAIRLNPESYFLLLRPFKNDWIWYDVLSHECFHLAQFIGNALKIWDDVEPPAYLHGWLTTTLRRVCSGHKKLSTDVFGEFLEL